MELRESGRGRGREGGREGGRERGVPCSGNVVYILGHERSCGKGRI
jgi:hypothetical protein